MMEWQGRVARGSAREKTARGGKALWRNSTCERRTNEGHKACRKRSSKGRAIGSSNAPEPLLLQLVLKWPMEG